MSTTLTIRDESTSGETTHELTLDFLTERITVRELIRSRVFQEVKDYNAKQADTFHGLVQPSEAEKTLNGYRMKKWRMIDWEKQFDAAVAAFEKSQILVLVNDTQVDDIGAEIEVATDTLITFLRLTPLVGG